MGTGFAGYAPNLAGSFGRFLQPIGTSGFSDHWQAYIFEVVPTKKEVTEKQQTLFEQIQYPAERYNSNKRVCFFLKESFG